MPRVITIDGPSGAGKSTASRRLAKELGFSYLDTGALYRAVALAASRDGIAPQEAERVAGWLPGIKVELAASAAGLLVILDGDDVEPHIRNEAIAGLASSLSALKPVRAWLLETQRKAGRTTDLVAEGRDMGTVVFPDARPKFFLTASRAERSRRRWRELKKAGREVSLEEVDRDMAARDQRDSERDLSPLAPAPDAVLIDNSEMNVDQVLETMLATVREG